MWHAPPGNNNSFPVAFAATACVHCVDFVAYVMYIVVWFVLVSTSLDLVTHCRYAAVQGGYDYNDKITPLAVALWVRLVEARFGATVFPDASYFPPGPAVDPAALAAFVTATKGT